MKKSLVVFAGLFFLLLWVGAVNAELITIGTANYKGADYNLIYQADAPFGPIVWFDYTSGKTRWTTQKNIWADGLNSALTINVNSGYSVNWDGLWRLPHTVDEHYTYGADGTTSAGYNITSSEMGYLFYTELGNKGLYDINGNLQSGYGLTNTKNFKHLVADRYWSGTWHDAPYSRDAWDFSMKYGSQYGGVFIGEGHGLAVRSGNVSMIPEPTTMLLLDFGLLGVAGVSRKKYS